MPSDTVKKDDNVRHEIIRRNIPWKLHYQARAEDMGDKPKMRKLEGYAAVFNKPFESEWFGTTFREFIAPKAFASALSGSDCRALFNHDANFPLARQSAGNLILREDEVGLWMEAQPTDTSFARDLEALVEDGVIKEQSFAFTIAREQWEEDNENDIVTRTILEIGELFDVSPVTYPAYKDTSVGARHQMRDIYDTWKELNDIKEERSENATHAENAQVEDHVESDTQTPSDSDSTQTPESRNDNQRYIRRVNYLKRKHHKRG